MEERIISVMAGLGARKSTKNIITPGLRDTERKSEESKRLCVSLLNCEAAGAHGSPKA